ncbi:MAG: Rhs family protein [Actinobacteria bacterium]|nr:Rhs family protein [Actinomycetota bacterium]
MSVLRLTSKITLFFFLLQCLMLQPSNALLLPPREASETAHRGVLQSLRVSPWSGTLSFNEKDIPSNDPILQLEATRAYSTDLAGADGEFGPGWTWKYGVRLLFDQKQIVYQDESGNAFLFKTDAKGLFRCPDLAGHTIIKKGASFIYTLHYGQEQSFDASGALTRISDLRNNSVKIERVKGRAGQPLLPAAQVNR